MSGMYFLKGVGIGMVAGATVVLIAMPKKKTLKTTCGKIMRTVGNIIDDVSDTLTH